VILTIISEEKRYILLPIIYTKIKKVITKNKTYKNKNKHTKTNMERKINLVGKNTLTISIPSKWTKRNKVTKGQTLNLNDEGNKLTITKNTKRKQKNHTHHHKQRQKNLRKPLQKRIRRNNRKLQQLQRNKKRHQQPSRIRNHKPRKKKNHDKKLRNTRHKTK